MSPLSVTENQREVSEEISSAQRLRPLSAPAYRVKGKLRLRFEFDSRANQTALTLCEQQPPLKVVRGFSLQDGGVLVHLHNLSGGVLGGDCLKTDVLVGSRARAQLTTAGATRLYRSRLEDQTAVQTNEIKVCEDGLLEYLPDELIPFKGSRYFQQTRIELSEGAGLFWWETVTPGREARAEVFAYELLRLNLDIKAGEKFLAQERVRLEPSRRPLASLIRLGHYLYFSTFYICRVGLEAARWLELEKQLGELAEQLSLRSEIFWGVSALTAHGLVIRAVSRKNRSLKSGLTAFWQAAKQQLYGEDAVPPRKVN
jgi:urease accessory protein